MSGPPPQHLKDPYRGSRSPNISQSSPGPPDEDVPAPILPTPIIKKEALEGFEEVPTQSETWATTADEIDYNKKLNFNEEDKANEEVSRSEHWRPGKYDRRSKDRDSRERFSKDQGSHGGDEEQRLRDRDSREKTNGLLLKDRDSEERSGNDNGNEKRFIQSCEMPRWQQPPSPQPQQNSTGNVQQQQQNKRLPANCDYRTASTRDYTSNNNMAGRGSMMRDENNEAWREKRGSREPDMPPGRGNKGRQDPHESQMIRDKRRENANDVLSKRRGDGDVQIALDRARHLHEEEEKRYDEKKRFEQSRKKGRDLKDSRDLSENRDDPELLMDQSRGSSESRDDKSSSRDIREYRQYPDHREGYVRDSYNSNRGDLRDPYERNYDRRDLGPNMGPVGGRDQNNRLPFKSKLPPRFQKLHQQGGNQNNPQMAPQGFNRGPPGPPHYDSRYSNQSNRYIGRDNEGKVHINSFTLFLIKINSYTVRFSTCSLMSSYLNQKSEYSNDYLNCTVAVILLFLSK